MATSAHAYIRGNALKFYECLECLQRGSLPEGLRSGSAVTATLGIWAPWRVWRVKLKSKFVTWTKLSSAIQYTT